MYMSTNELSYTSDTLHSLNCSVVFLILMLIFPSKGREINLRFKFKLPHRTVYLHRGRAPLINIRETTKDNQCGCTARGLTHCFMDQNGFRVLLFIF